MAKSEKVVLDAMKKAGKPLRPGDVVKITCLPKKDVSTAIKELKKKWKNKFSEKVFLCSGLRLLLKLCIV